MRHALGVLGVLAAGVLLAVSVAMNWRFGFSLGRTELDGQIYGAASAAADCLKALAPFFFFAAIRTRMWSQAAASAMVWTIVTTYSFTSCLGHAALNRYETSGHRAVEAETYQDLRAELKRAQDQLSWVPKHRPADVIQSDIDNAKNQRAWTFTNGCADVSGKQGRDFCQGYHALTAELASAAGSSAMDKRVAEIQGKLAAATGASAMASADPQAAVLASITGISVEKVQMSMTIFIALLLEIGSGFGMYIAFSQWRIYDNYEPAPRAARRARPAAAEGPDRREMAANANIETLAETLASPPPAGPPLLEGPVSREPPPEAALLPDSEPTVAAAPASEPASEPAAAPVEAAPPAVAAETADAPAPLGAAEPPVSANDNKAETRKKPVLPESDVQRYYRERIESRHGGSAGAKEVLADYVAWCKEKNRKPLAASLFGKEFQDCGNVKERNRYKGIVLKSALDAEAAAPPPEAKIRAA